MPRSRSWRDQSSDGDDQTCRPARAPPDVLWWVARAREVSRHAATQARTGASRTPRRTASRSGASASRRGPPRTAWPPLERYREKAASVLEGATDESRAEVREALELHAKFIGGLQKKMA